MISTEEWMDAHACVVGRCCRPIDQSDGMGLCVRCREVHLDLSERSARENWSNERRLDTWIEFSSTGKMRLKQGCLT